VRCASVNGSGSASANELFAKAILRMGVPVAPRNIFPSNIQGLPTWYEVRVSGRGWLGRRGGVDLLVAMNPQTWDADVAGLEPGGYLLYDSSRPPPAHLREDITALGVPLTRLCTEAWEWTRMRQLSTNTMYVCALWTLLGIDAAAIVALVAEQFRAKPRVVGPNVEATRIGGDGVGAHLPHPIGLRVAAADAVG